MRPNLSVDDAIAQIKQSFKEHGNPYCGLLSPEPGAEDANKRIGNAFASARYQVQWNHARTTPGYFANTETTAEAFQRLSDSSRFVSVLLTYSNIAYWAEHVLGEAIKIRHHFASLYGGDDFLGHSKESSPPP